jgi:hypothetical protein
MTNRKQGTVESYEHVYEPLRSLGVPARVWDEVLDEVFHEPFGVLALPLQELLFELEVGEKARADYPRADGISDHDFVLSILQRAKAEFESKGADHARLMRDDSWDDDETLGIRTKPTEKGLN